MELSPDPAIQVARLRRETVRGRLVSLVPYAESHAGQVIALRNQPDARYNLNQGEPSTPEMQAAWHRKYLARGNDLFWVIADGAGGVAGCTGLYDIDAEAGIGEKGRLIIDATSRHAAPFALESELLLVGVAFRELGLRTLVTIVRHDNLKMQSMNRRLGFRETGTLEVRGVPYLRSRLERDAYDPSALERIVEHWGARGD